MRDSNLLSIFDEVPAMQCNALCPTPADQKIRVSDSFVRHPCLCFYSDYFLAILASMHSVACGTFIRRSFGISFPVVLQMP